MSKRLEILEKSLLKKSALLSSKIEDHFNSVKQANGQPLNDKRNGQATLRKWEKQNDSIRSLNESIERTKQAIEIEKGKISAVNNAKESLPDVILSMLESGRLIQWRKHPNTFFINGVDKARIVWDPRKKIIFTRHKDSIKDQETWKIFASTFNQILKSIQ